MNDIRAKEPRLDYPASPDFVSGPANDDRQHGRRRRSPLGIVLGAGAAVAVVAIGVAAGLWTGVITLPSTLPGTVAVAATDGTVAQTADNGTPAVAQAPAPVAKVVSQQDFGDWLYMCIQPTADAGSVTCSIMQRLTDRNSGAAAFLWRIAQNGENGLLGIWQVPQAVSLTRGLELDAGTPKPIVIPYDSCGNGRCQAVANLGEDFVQTLAKAEKITARFTLTSGDPISLDISTAGLADALKALHPTPGPAAAGETPASEPAAAPSTAE